MIAIAIENPMPSIKATVPTNLVTGFTSALNITLSYGPSSPFTPSSPFQYIQILTPNSKPQHLLQRDRRTQGPQRLP